MNVWKPIDAFTHAMLGELEPTGRNWARAGTLILIAGIAMAADFGWQVSFKHAAFLSGVCFVTAFAPEAAYRAFELRKWFIGGVSAAAALGFFVIQFGVDQSYTAGARGKNRDETRVQNTRYDGAQDAAKEDKANLEMWKKQLAELTAQNAWAATVKAEALREQVANADAYIKMEAARGGCKQKCEQRMRERDALVTKIGTIEQAEDLTKRIEATQRILDKKRDVASNTAYQSSAVEHSNNQIAESVAFLFGGNLEPTKNIAKGADIAINMAMALAAACGHALCYLIAGGLYRRKEHSFDGKAQGLFGAPKETVTNRHVTHNLFLDPFAGKAIAHSKAT